MYLDVNPLSDGTDGVALWVGRLNDTQDLFSIETDPSKNVDECGPPSCDRLKYDGEEEVLGRPMASDLVDPSCKEDMQNALDKALDGESTKGLEVPLVCKDGSIETIVADVTPRMDDDGNVNGAVVQESSESGLGSLMDALGGLMAWITDESGDVVICSAKAAEVLG